MCLLYYLVRLLYCIKNDRYRNLWAGPQVVKSPLLKLRDEASSATASQPAVKLPNSTQARLQRRTEKLFTRTIQRQQTMAPAASGGNPTNRSTTGQQQQEPIGTSSESEQSEREQQSGQEDAVETSSGASEHSQRELPQNQQPAAAEGVCPMCGHRLQAANVQQPPAEQQLPQAAPAAQQPAPVARVASNQSVGSYQECPAAEAPAPARSASNHSQREDDNENRQEEEEMPPPLYRRRGRGPGRARLIALERARALAARRRRRLERLNRLMW